jgi:hypothetical protein
LKPEQLASDIGVEVRRALKPSMDSLLESIRELTHSIDTQRHPAPFPGAETDTMLDRLMRRLDGGHLAAESQSDSGPGKAGGRWRIPGFNRGAHHKAGVE